LVLGKQAFALCRIVLLDIMVVNISHTLADAQSRSVMSYALGYGSNVFRAGNYYFWGSSFFSFYPPAQQ